MERELVQCATCGTLLILQNNGTTGIYKAVSNGKRIVDFTFWKFVKNGHDFQNTTRCPFSHRHRLMPVHPKVRRRLEKGGVEFPALPA